MESEKVKEIKKGLKCCSILMDNNATSEEQDNSCNDCPYRINDRCSWKLDSDALTYINELESENDCKDIEISKQEYQIGKLKDRIAELEKETAEAICKRLEKWGGDGRLYANELRKEYGIGDDHA